MTDLTQAEGSAVGPAGGSKPWGCGWEFSVLKGRLCEQTKGLEVGAHVGVLTQAGIWEGGGKISHGTTAVLGDRSVLGPIWSRSFGK